MSKLWTAKETRVYTGDGGFDIRNLPNAEERAVLIVKAVNSHDALVKALEEIASDPAGVSVYQAEIAREALAKMASSDPADNSLTDPSDVGNPE